MELSFASLVHPQVTKRGFDGMKTSALTPSGARKSSTGKMFPCFATVATRLTSDGIKDNKLDLERRKRQLLTAIQDTQRGLMTSADQRSTIEEALVGLESYSAGTPIELLDLDGTWRLEYTSAPDVLILLESSARLPFFQDEDGATLLVSAKFSVVSWRSIYLQFEEIAVQDIDTSKLQVLIAPAILPRSFLSLQILQFIQSFKAQVPVRSQGRQTVGGLYYLSYLDGNMLLGRADRGGAFVFTRTRPFVV
ncbi:probable plastid-lipid-associated protein 10, chloroplastic isoform X2 [Rhododendron vialii]|uniref:probable plastid-lipid-associated protein 10, chloroplastic isoform X2 n=1 Tax=Rhododendron vialii TaxID=182163 RepID=UPI00265E66A5|nr:probable plastid-lipid-associated protein 10, chloroplastic isoform X2 [Rhododendron vialii]